MPETAASTPPDPWQPWAIGRLQAFLTTVLGAVASLGFVAFVGGVLMWARTKALGLPADDVVAVVPRRDLIATGASALALFALAAVVAIGLVYLFDRYGVPGRRTRLSLLALMTVELVVAILYADPDPTEVIVGGGLLVLVICGLGGILFFRTGIFIAAPFPSPPPPSATPTPTPPTDDWSGLQESILDGVREWGAAAAAADPAPTPTPTPTPERSTQPSSVDGDLRLTIIGSTVVLALMIFGSVGVWFVFDRWWVVVSVALAFTLHLVTVAVARASGTSFGGTAAAVLIGVVVFGACVSALRYWQDKPVQAVVALRADEADPVCGIYVTEADDRMYLARIDRGSAATAHTSHLFWVSRKDVSGWALGALESQERAEQALKQLSTRVLEERRAHVTATTSHKTTNTTPKSGTETKVLQGGSKKRPGTGATSPSKTDTEETKTVLPPPSPMSGKTACSIYSAP